MLLKPEQRGQLVEDCGEKLNIVVLIALSEELEEFRKVFPHKQDHSQGNQICLEHESGCDGIRLISVLAEEMGSQSAAKSAKVAVENFDPDLLAVVGIAGGVSSDVELTDVVVSNEILDVIQNSKVTDRDGVSEISFSPDFYNVSAELVASFAFLKGHPDLRQLYDD
jgi:adenosylhomocysteine nucleosidase